MQGNALLGKSSSHDPRQLRGHWSRESCDQSQGFLQWSCDVSSWGEGSNAGNQENRDLTFYRSNV